MAGAPRCCHQTGMNDRNGGKEYKIQTNRKAPNHIPNPFPGSKKGFKR